MSYNDVSQHLLMLSDKIRTEAYKAAIEAAVQAGDKVIDFGCGTGVLSIFASRSGAEQVYAIDRATFIKAAKEIAKRNQISNISFLHSEGDQVQLEEKVDLIVSEWMGHFLFWEWMLEPLIALRDRHLKPGGKMLPKTASLYVAMVCSPKRHLKKTFFQEPQYGIDFSPIKDWPLHEPSLERFSKEDIAQPGQLLETIDLQNCSTTPKSFSTSITAESDYQAYGIAGWFECQLTEHIDLKTGPDADKTHWLQAYFPALEPIKVSKGDTIEFELKIVKPDDSSKTGWAWKIRHNGKTQQLNNLAHDVWLNV